jgi:hypothetical protein
VSTRIEACANYSETEGQAWWRGMAGEERSNGKGGAMGWSASALDVLNVFHGTDLPATCSEKCGKDGGVRGKPTGAR